MQEQHNPEALRYFIHDLHNKLAVVRTSAGLIDHYSIKADAELKSLLQEHVAQIDGILDEISDKLNEFSTYLRLQIDGDNLAELPLSMLFREVSEIAQSLFATSIQVDVQGEIMMNHEHALTAFDLLIRTVVSFAEMPHLIRVAGSASNLAIEFRLRETMVREADKLKLFMNDNSTVELHGEPGNIYLVKKILEAYNVRLIWEQFTAKDVRITCRFPG